MNNIKPITRNGGRRYVAAKKGIKMKYVINYEYGIAEMYTPKTDNPVDKFESLANQCFGIRKSIGDCTLVSESKERMPKPWRILKDAKEMLSHNGDIIVWDSNGKKIKSEFE